MNDTLDDFLDHLKSTPTSKPARPILKWVGGKTQLLAPILAAMPASIETYYEPFIGGGAVFFALAAEGRFKQARINDWNDELINLYSVTRDCLDELIAELTTAQQSYNHEASGTFHSFRSRDFKDGEMSLVERATRTVLLNKTGFNGLYRQNKAGKFNVPWGKKEKVTIFEEENLRACSAAFKKVERFTIGDFAPAVADAGPGDVVYMDPPYIPHSATSNFTGYTSDGFSMDDQRRVADTARQLVAQGAHVIVSNNDVPAIYELFEGFEIQQVKARRNVNSKGDKRGEVGEVIVVGRPDTLSVKPAST